MHLDTHSTFWVVIDPRPESALVDLIHQTSMTGFLGMVEADQVRDTDNPAIHDNSLAAEVDAQARFFALRLRRAIQDGGNPEALRDASRVQLRDGTGKVLFDAMVE